MAQVRQQFIIQSEALRTEAATFGMAAGAAAAYRYEHEKLAQAKAAGIALSDAQIAKIREEAATTGRLTQAVTDLQNAKVAADAVGGAMVDALFSWASGAKSASDAIRDLTLSLAKMLLQASLLGQGPLAGIFGTQPGGGLLGGLLTGILGVGGGKARGGYVSANDTFTLGFVANDNFAVGAIARRAAGGMIRGPGTSTSDSIPTLLSDGEYVVNARATAKHRPLLDAINSGTVRGFASGGLVMPPPPTTSGSGNGGAAPAISVGGTSITVQGNLDEKTWPRVQAELAKRDAEMAGQVLRIVTDAQSRGII